MKEGTPEFVQAIRLNLNFPSASTAEKLHGLEVYSSRGIEDYKRYVAKKMTENTNFVYKRWQRGLAEQGSGGRIYLSMFTYSKSVFSLVYKNSKIISNYLRSKATLLDLEKEMGKEGSRRAGWFLLWAMVFGAWMGDKFMKEFT